MTRLLPPAGPATSTARSRPALRSATRLRLRISGALLALYGVIVLLVALTPTPVDRPYEGVLARLLVVLHDHGLPIWIGYAQVEFGANILLFVPVGFLLALVLPQRDWWLAAVLAPTFSALLEVAQALFLPERFPSVLDVLANGLGGATGAVLSLALRGALRRRDRRVLAEAAAREAADDDPAGDRPERGR